MKKITLIIILINNLCFSQTITISDIGFKNKLLQSDISNTIAKDISGNNIKIDSNEDNEIQLSEAINVSKINLDFAFETSNILTLDGIENFSNLKELSTYEVHLTSFNYSLDNLEKLGLNYCLIKDLDLSNCPVISDLTFISKNQSLETIDLQNGSNISSIDILNSGNLSSVCVDTGELLFVSSELSEYSNVTITDSCDETLSNHDIKGSITYKISQGKNIISIDSNIDIKEISLYNINGIKIISNSTKFLNIENYINGMYIIIMNFENGHLIREKIILN